MLIADLKNKLSLTELISEDFLTSSVFSYFRYVNKLWLEKFINNAINIENEKLSLNINDPMFEFWPWHSNEAKYGYGAEPDVIIYAENKAIIIEAKNYSGKSGTGIIYEEEYSQNDVNQNNRKRIIDQLGREYFVGLNKILNSIHEYDNNTENISEFYLIYLTRHKYFPEKEIQETIDYIEEISPGSLVHATKIIYWLNWQKSIPIINEVISCNSPKSFEYIISNELRQFLDKRDISSFNGFNFLLNHIELKSKKIPDVLFFEKKSSAYWNFLYQHNNLSKYKIETTLFNKKKSAPYFACINGYIKTIINFGTKNNEVFYYTAGVIKND